MVIRFLLLVLLAYFVLRTVRNLARAMRSNGAPVAPRPASRVQPTRPPGEPVRRNVFEDEVEDARFRDL